MPIDNTADKIEFFTKLVDSLDGKSVVDTIYRIICTYGIPDVADREFLVTSLMAVFLKHEEYEKCEVLKRNEFRPNVSYNSIEELNEDVTSADIKFMALMGFFKSIKITTL